MTQGWIKVDRGLLEHGIFEDGDLLRVWMYCLLKATHKARKVPIGRQMVQLEPGQLLYGRKAVSERLGLSERSLRGIINQLVQCESIRVDSNNRYSVITIVNWNVYQKENLYQEDGRETAAMRPADDRAISGMESDFATSSDGNMANNCPTDDQQMTDQRPVSDQQTTTNKNVKNAKNDKTDKNEKNNQQACFRGEIAEWDGVDLAGFTDLSASGVEQSLSDEDLAQLEQLFQAAYAKEVPPILSEEVNPFDGQGGMPNYHDVPGGSDNLGVAKIDTPVDGLSQRCTRSSGEADNAVFERLWKQYPVQKGRFKLTKQQVAQVVAEGEARVQQAIQRYCKEQKGQNRKYWMHGNTFFAGGYQDYLPEVADATMEAEQQQTAQSQFVWEALF